MFDKSKERHEGMKSLVALDKTVSNNNVHAQSNGFYSSRA